VIHFDPQAAQSVFDALGPQNAERLAVGALTVGGMGAGWLAVKAGWASARLGLRDRGLDDDAGDRRPIAQAADLRGDRREQREAEGEAQDAALAGVPIPRGAEGRAGVEQARAVFVGALAGLAAGRRLRGFAEQRLDLGGVGDVRGC
jgi:hypothetical protein